MRHVAAAVPVRFNERIDSLEFLLVTAIKDPSELIFPKGGVKPKEEASAAAVRETLEEAGVICTAGEHLNTTIVKKTRIELYVVYVTQDAGVWQEKGRRSRKWVSMDEALNVLRRAEMLEALRHVKLRHDTVVTTAKLLIPQGAD